MDKENKHLLYIRSGGNKFIRIGKKASREDLRRYIGDASADDINGAYVAYVESIEVLWGFMDGNGREVIPCRYFEAEPFSDGLARVCDGGFEYFINESGEVAFECDESYEYGLFENGLCEIHNLEEGTYGYVNKRGEIVSPIVDDFKIFSEGLQVQDLGDGPCEWINEKYHVVIGQQDFNGSEFNFNGSDFHDRLAWASHAKYGHYGYLDQRGQVVVPFVFSNASAWDHGMAPVSVDGKWGFIDLDCNLLIPYKYEQNNGFDKEGIMLYEISTSKDPDTGEPRDFIYGAIDRSGREIIPVNDSETETLYHGIAKIDGKIAVLTDVKDEKCENCRVVKWFDISVPQSDKYVYEFECDGLDIKKVAKFKDGLLRWGYLNGEGEEIIPCIYDDAMIGDGLLRLKKNGLWAFVSPEGKFLTPFIYDSAFSRVLEGLCAVQRNGLWGFINEKGEEVIPCMYDAVTDFDESRSLVLLEGEYGFIDIEGKAITPLKYSMAHPFSDGLAWVQTYDGAGNINMDGEEVIPCRFHQVGECSEGFVGVCERTNKGKGDYYMFSDTEDHYMFFDKSGNIVIDLAGIELDDLSIFKEGLCGISKHGLWGFIDRTGKEVIPCKFSWPYFNVQIQFSHGLCIIGSEKQRGRVGAIDKLGEIVIPAVYYDIQWEENESRWAAYTGEETHYYNKEGKRIASGNGEKS